MTNAVGNTDYCIMEYNHSIPLDFIGGSLIKVKIKLFQIGT